LALTASVRLLTESPAVIYDFTVNSQTNRKEKFMRRRVLESLAGLIILWASCASLSAQSLGTALDNTNLTWTTSGTGGGQSWFGQTVTFHYGGSAAQSGSISSSSQTSILQTTVTGPGTLTYWWKVATTYSGSPTAGSSLTAKVNGVTQTNLYDNVDWNQQTIYLGDGTQTVQWVLSYYVSVIGAGTGWVDQLTWTPGQTAPLIYVQPPGQAVVPGLDATFRTAPGGTPPLAYQWRFNGTNISDATNAICVINNVQPANLGDYCVVITNVAGSITSSIAPLVFGNVAAWGSYASGQSTIPNQCTNALAIGAGYSSSLILNPDHTVTAWGQNQTNVPAGTNFISVAGCSWHSLALKADGTVAGWGYDYNGDTIVPTGLSNVVALAGGGYHSMVLRTDGTVIAWGDNAFGQTNVPVDLTNAVAIAAGVVHSVALQADGRVRAWGYNNYGQCNVPASLTNAVAVAAANMRSLALRADGTVTVWGDNTGGAANVPTDLTNAVAIAAGITYGLALQSDGRLTAWGSPFITNFPVVLSNVVAIAGGQSHALAIIGDGPPVQQILVTNASVGTSGFSLTLPSQSGRVFRLEYKNDLEDADWTALPLVAGNGTNLTLTDLTATNTIRFYRVRRW
jgi:alpha-tubulin suppressor-like RCC1 family protein